MTFYSFSSARSQRQSGFALLITIVLVAFLVMILVGVATVTRVETTVSENAEDIARARQNAVAALNVAVGELQRTAGHDQRVTARADILAATNASNSKWTGVWDASNPASTPTWLVSGVTLPAANATATGAADGINRIQLVGAGTTDLSVATNEVVAPSVDLKANDVPGVANVAGGHTIGRIAWWVGDEGIKARANVVSPWPLAASVAPARDAQSGYNFAMAQRSGIEQMAREVNPAVAGGTAIGTTAYVPNDIDLRAVLSTPQLPFSIPATAPAADQAAVSDAYRFRFHDITTHSVSVLANVKSGGLKKDLSRWLESPAVVGAPADADSLFSTTVAASPDFFRNPPTWGQLRSFANTQSNGAALAPRLPSATSQGISPIMVWVEVGFSLGLNPAQTNARAHYFPRVLLWNPYNVPLATGGYEIGWRGPGGVDVTVQANGAGTGTAYYNLERNSFATTTTAGSTNFLRFRLDSGVLAPGECAVYTIGTSGVYNSNGDNLLARADTTNSVYFDDSVIPFVADPDPAVTDKVQVSYPPAVGGEIDAYLRDWVSGQAAITDFSPNTYHFISRIGTVQTPDIGSYGTSAANTLTADFRLFARARLGAANGALAMRWIANGNIRAPFLGRSAVTADNSDYHPLYQGSATTSATPAVDATTILNSNYVVGPVTDRLALFQVPRADTPLFSVADLRHANLSLMATGPAYPVATSLQDFRITRANDRDVTTPSYPLYDYAYLLNDSLWDLGYFSTVPAALPANYPSDPNYASLPNARLLYFQRNGAYPTSTDLLDPDLTAANLVLSGGFNINSTSVQAWRAQLSALNGITFDPVAGTDGGAALNRAFSRFLRPLANSANPYRGFRELTDVQINRLAEELVTEIKTRGPFRSLAEFVNRDLAATADGLKGPLQEAIDSTDVNATPSNRINDSVPWTDDMAADPAVTTGYDLQALKGLTGAATPPVSSRNAGGPGNLTQADVLAALGPILTPRSDTFLVRAYGDVVNPVTGATSGRAWCEAVVQRMPNYINSADSAEVYPPVNGDNTTFGRRFQVISFRWLGPDDI